MNEQIYRELFEDVGAKSGPPDRPVSWIENHIIEDIKNMGYAGPIMDAGCSSGYLTAMLSEEFGAVYGVDINPQQLIVAQKVNSRRNIQYVVVDLREPIPETLKSKTIIAMALLSAVNPRDRLGIIYHLVRNTCVGGQLVIYDRVCSGEPVEWDGYSSPIHEGSTLNVLSSIGVPYEKTVIAHSAVGHLIHRIVVRVAAGTAGKFLTIPEWQTQFTA